jgi:NADP-dependent malic enzyme
VLIFPNLEAANISYKLLKETEHLDTIGPVILGLTKPIHVATLGSTVDEMVNLATLAVIQAQSE